jgi:cytosine/adenosine deaminase-related metal-dependent hydrolase
VSNSNVSPAQTSGLPLIALTHQPVTNDPQTLDRHGILDCGIPVIFSHASFLDSTGARLLRSKNHYISITPESEAHYGHDNRYSHEIQDQAAFGVDTPFAFSPDILTQSRMWLQRVRDTRYRRVLDGWEIPNKCPMSTDQAFLMATRHGGLALRRPDIGVLSPGAKADLLVFRCDRPNMLGWTDPVAAVMLHANIADIEHVMIDGRWKKRDGQLVLKQGSLVEVQKRFRASAERLQKILEGIPPPELQGRFFGMSKYKNPESVEFPQKRDIGSRRHT